MAKNEVKYGAILSYVLIFANTVYGLVLAPYILSKLGEGDYGVYKTIASFSATLMVLDFGIGTTVMRYTAKYRAEKNKQAIGNFAAMGMLEASIMCGVLLIVSTVIFFLIDPMYARTFTAGELTLSKQIFVILIVNMILTVVENVLNGVIIGSNALVFSNTLKLVSLLARIALIVVILAVWQSAIALVLISLLMTVCIIITQTIYISKKLQIRIKLIKWEKSLFKESLKYTLLMFVQTLAIQANGNIDNISIGAIVGSAAVTVYSFGIQMFNMFESLATSLSNLMLPSVSMKIAQGADDREMQAMVTKAGRFQFLLLGAAAAGFIAVGKEFLTLWLGEGFENVYALALIMMIPVMFTLIENVCLSILRARNMMGFRTLALILMALFNALITVIGTYFFGYFAAAVGTGLSIVFGSVILMNIYYHKKLGFRVFRFYRDVLHNLWICAIVPGIVIYIIGRFFSGSWVAFLVKVVIYVVLYAALLLAFGLNETEKTMIFGRFRRRIS